MKTGLLVAALAAGQLLSACSAGPEACNGAPTAVAGPAQAVAKRAAVQLSGAALATRGQPSYEWRLDAVPPGSAAVLSSPTSSSPGFAADAAGVYVATLVVRDACAASAPASVVVTAANRAPAASSVAEQWVQPGATVTLDGTGSIDEDQDPLTFQWTLLLKPMGSAAALSSAREPASSFVADAAGTYLARLVVSDGATASAPADVVVHAGSAAGCTASPPPTAVAGPAQTVAKRASVTLVGSAAGARGEPAYAWQLTAIPAASAASLASPTSSSPSFTADVAGVYVATLIVHDGCAASAPASVVVTATNRPPVASAGPGSVVLPGSTVTLDGGGSADADGDPLAFQWTLLSRPAGSAAALSSATAKSVKFLADLAGTYLVRLAVSDGEAASAPADVVVQAGTPDGCLNVPPPVAVAGPPQAVSKRALVHLSGSAPGARGSPVYAWQLTAAPAGSAAVLSAPDTARPAFTADLPGAYVATLTVRDDCGSSAPAVTVVTVANRPPVASGGPDRQVMPGNEAVLDGGGSSDPDQDPLTYQWSIAYRPTGSAAALAGATTAVARLVPDAYGTYVVLLVVGDGESTSAPARVTIQSGVTGPGGTCAPAAPPSASIAAPSPRYAGSVQLDGSGSTTGRPSPLVYRWSVVAAPAGSAPTLSENGVAKPTLYLDRPGGYEVSLVVNDGCIDSSPATQVVTRANNPPFAYVYGPYQPVPILVPLTLDANAHDYDSEPLTYRWQVASRPLGSAAAFSAADTLRPTFTPDLVGSYSLSLVVSDGSASTTASVTFTALNLPPVAAAGSDKAATVGAVVALDGSTSKDPSLRPLTFAWTLQRPPGSAAVLTTTTSATSSFTPDVPGTYLAQLAVGAGGLTGTDSVVVAAWPAITRLAHRVVAAGYSASLDRVVMVSADPNALYLYDPRGSGETSVPLSLPPSSVSVGPDGKFAAVGHVNAISYVDLIGAAVQQVLPVSADVSGVALGDNNYIYAMSRSGQYERIRFIAVPSGGGGPQPSTTSALYGAAAAKFRRLAGTLYLTGNGSNAAIEEYVISGGTPYLAAPSGAASLNSCGDLWFSQDAARLFTRCAAVLSASSSPAFDLLAAGVLQRPGNAALILRHLDESAAAGEISAVSSEDLAYSCCGQADDRTIRRWSAEGLGAREALPFPGETVAGTFRSWYGRFVFYRSDGSERYVVLQLDPLAGALHDFGIVTY